MPGLGAEAASLALGTAHLPPSRVSSEILEEAGLAAPQTRRQSQHHGDQHGEANPKSPPPVAAQRFPSQGPGGWTRALPEHTALFPGLTSLTGSQCCLPDTLARPAEDSLAPGPKLRPPEDRAERGLSATALQLWPLGLVQSAPALSGVASVPASQGSCSAQGQWEGSPSLATAAPSTACPGTGRRSWERGSLLPFLSKTRATRATCRAGP